MIKIRLAKKSDLNVLSEVYVEVYRAFDIGERWDKKSARKLLAYWLDKQPELAFLAEENNKIVGGFFTGMKPWWDGNHLSDGELFVHPDYQRRGIGGKLMKTAFQKAVKKYKAVQFDAFTFKKTKHPLAWYKSIGFNEVKEWTIINGNLEKVIKKI